MKISITIGAYKLTEFVALNLAQCRELFGDDTPIIVSDDRSPQSEQMAKIAEEYGASYVGVDKRMSHFTGDCQHFINTAMFGQLTQSDVCLKISQRFIPAHPRFIEVVMEPFKNDEISAVFPGQPQKRQMARPNAMFYAGFGLLTDFAAWRPSRLTASQIESFYRHQMSDVTDERKGKHLIEVTMGRIADKILGNKIVTLGALANHEIGHPKIYLRKAQSNRGEYQTLAKKHGIEGEFDVREWGAIEGKDYLPMGPII